MTARNVRLLVGAALLLGPASLAMAQPQTKAQRPRLPEGVTVDRDLEYARVGDRPLHLDLYRPEGAEGPLPLVVWVHGGGWQAGSKDRTPAVALVPQDLLNQLRTGGRLIGIVGSEPVMRAVRITRTADTSFQTVELFDTVAPRLQGFEAPTRFTF